MCFTLLLYIYIYIYTLEKIKQCATCNTIDILKLLNISLPSLSINDTFNWSILHLPAFCTECSLAQSKRNHQMICLY